MGLDRDFERAHIEVDAPVLEFFGLINAPRGLAWDAEARMVHDEEEFAAGFQMLSRVLESCCRIFEVLCHEDHGSVGKLFFF